MSEPDDWAMNFLQRWSLRKRAAENLAPDAAKPSPRERMDGEANVSSGAAIPSEAALPAFDPATLPPIESITAITDIRAFLAPGVPEELTRAALRRVWLTDPTIRDFVGLAENQWDFTKPDSVPGFGSLTPELCRMVAGMFGGAREPTSPQGNAGAASGEIFAEMPGKTTAPTPQPSGRSDANVERPEHLPAGHLITSEKSHPDTVLVTSEGDNHAALQENIGDGANPRLAHRKHGGAVPK